MPVLPLASLLLLTVNGLTVLRFWQDKGRARRGEWRVPEADLLWLALLGGSPGALVARCVFRHKTRKEPFSTRLLLIVVVQIVVASGLAAALHR